MTYADRITADYRVMLGKPVINGTRITVAIILRKVAEGSTIADLTAMHPHLQETDLLATVHKQLVISMLISSRCDTSR